MYGLAKRNGNAIRPRIANDWFNNMFGPLEKLSAFKKNERGDYVGEFDVPGFGENDIELTINNNIVTMRGKQKNRSVNHVVAIPEDADTAKAEATIKNGVLSIALPIMESEKPKQITIKSG